MTKYFIEDEDFGNGTVEAENETEARAKWRKRHDVSARDDWFTVREVTFATPPVTKSECCHAPVGYDAWVDSNGEICGGPFDNHQCMNCGMESPGDWDGKSPPWPRDEREGGADLPDDVDEPDAGAEPS